MEHSRYNNKDGDEIGIIGGVSSELVRQAEISLLKRQLSKALERANRYLVHHNNNIINNFDQEKSNCNIEDIITIQLKTKLIYPFDQDQIPRCFSIRMSSSSSSTNIEVIDRAAVVALQSWHEIISCKIKNYNESSSSRISGLIHLKPYLTNYLSRPIPLAAFNVFLRFCIVHDCMSQAAILSFEIILSIVRYKKLNIILKEDIAIKELVIILFTKILPFCTTQQQQEELCKALNSAVLQGKIDSSMLQLKYYYFKTQTNNFNSVQIIEKFCIENSFEILGSKIWQDAFDECKVILSKMKLELSQNNNFGVKNNQCSKNNGTCSDPKAIQYFVDSKKDKLIEWSKNRMIDLFLTFKQVFLESPRRWEHRAKLAVSILMILLSNRDVRYQFYSKSKTMLRALFKWLMYKSKVNPSRQR